MAASLIQATAGVGFCTPRQKCLCWSISRLGHAGNGLLKSERGTLDERGWGYWMGTLEKEGQGLWVRKGGDPGWGGMEAMNKKNQDPRQGRGGMWTLNEQDLFAPVLHHQFLTMPRYGGQTPHHQPRSLGWGNEGLRRTAESVVGAMAALRTASSGGILGVPAPLSLHGMWPWNGGFTSWTNPPLQQPLLVTSFPMCTPKSSPFQWCCWDDLGH